VRSPLPELLSPHSPGSMTVATLPLSNVQRSLSCLSLSSHSRPSSSPAMIQLFPPQDLSSTNSNLASPVRSSPTSHIPRSPIFTICLPRHLRTFPVPDKGGTTPRIPSDAVSDRSSAFFTGRSRVLKASHIDLSPPSHSTAFLVLQPPTAALCFSSRPLPRHASE
jgi:hypothetical protein